MEKSLLSNLLSNQHLILSYIQDKLEIVNFIQWGYDNKLPTLSTNSFVAFGAVTAYRSLLVDICMLFQEHKHQTSNFHLLIDNSKKYIRELEDDAITTIEGKLKEASYHFHDQILELRNEDISHYRYREEVSISFNLEYLPEINKLTQIALDILTIASSGFKDKSNADTFDVGLGTSWIYGLSDIVKKINGIDYYKKWKAGL